MGKHTDLLGRLTLTGALALGITSSADASFVLTVTQSGANVVFNGTGSINTSGLTMGGISTGGGVVYGTPYIIGVGIGPAPVRAFSGAFTSTGGPFTTGTNDVFTADFDTGLPFDIVPQFGQLFVDPGYVSNALFTDSSIFNNTTIAGLGLIAGTYTYSFGSGATADSVTVNIGVGPQTVPEPGALALFGVGLAALGLRSRKPRS